MKRIGVAAAAAVIATGWPFLAHAQSAGDWARCRATADSLQRLSCYDGIGPQPAAAASSGDAYQPMSLVDWKLDRRSLGRAKVEVEGAIMSFADQAMLSIKPGDTSPVFVDVTGLSRDQRRRLIACSGFCQATVRGRSGSVMGQDGLIADSVTIR